MVLSTASVAFGPAAILSTGGGTHTSQRSSRATQQATTPSPFKPRSTSSPHMKSWLRHILPFGFVRYAQLSSELRRLGLSASSARRMALARGAAARLRRAHFDLLPNEALQAVDCAIDIGANVGDWTADLMLFCQPRQVLCVEPDPTLANELRLRFAANHEIHVEELAVGDSCGRADLRVMHNPVLNSFRQPSASMAALFPEPFRIENSVRVEVKTLDSIAPKDGRISLLKIDVQGFEREVLRGAEETLRRTDIAIIEVNFQPHYDGEAGFFELDAIMHQHGFCIGNYSAPKGGRRQALFADVVYLRQES